MLLVLLLRALADGIDKVASARISNEKAKTDLNFIGFCILKKNGTVSYGMLINFFGCDWTVKWDRAFIF